MINANSGGTAKATFVLIIAVAEKSWLYDQGEGFFITTNEKN